MHGLRSWMTACLLMCLGLCCTGCGLQELLSGSAATPGANVLDLIPPETISDQIWEYPAPPR